MTTLYLNAIKYISKRQHLFLIVFLLPLALFAQDWQVKEAPYRLQVKQTQAKSTGFIPLGQYQFPEHFINGIDVRSNTGEKVPFFLYSETYELITTPSPDSQELFIYFGFKDKQEFNQWPKESTTQVPGKYALSFQTKKFHLPAQSKAERKIKRKTRRDKYLNIHNKNIERQTERIAKITTKISILKTSGEEKKKDLKKQQSAKKMAGNEKAKDSQQKIVSLQEEIKQNSSEISALEQTLMHANKLLKQFNEKKEKLLKKYSVQKKVEDEKGLRMLEYFYEKKGVAPERPFKKIYIISNPFEDNYNFGVRFSGNLKIATAGDYDFAINSTSHSCLVIDDKLVVAWPHPHPKSKTWEKTGRVKLEPGLHSFRFYYQKNQGDTLATAAWKKASEPNDHYQILVDTDFTPGYPLTLINCTDQQNHSYPIITYPARSIIHFEKNNKTVWERCSVVNYKNPETLQWIFGKDKIYKGNTIDLFMNDLSPKSLSIQSTTKEFPDYTIKFPPLHDDDENLQPNLFMRLWTPSFIYDDETLEMDIEVCSELPKPIELYLKTDSSKSNSMIKTGIEKISLLAKTIEDNNKYTPAHFVKRKSILKGIDLKDGMTLTYSIDLPMFTIHKQQLKFIPISQLPDLTETPEGLVDIDGNKVVPVLHRLSLPEKRNWSFSHLLRNKVLFPKKVLVIGDNFGKPGTKLQETLKEALAKKGATLEFLNWKQLSTGIPSRDSFASFAKTLKTTNTEAVIIIPSAKDIELGTPTRLHKRILAALIAILRENASIRIIKICTPFPSIFHQRMNKELVDEIKYLSREYAIEPIDLNFFIKQNKNWQDLYKSSSDDVSLAPFPIQAIKAITKHITEALP